MSVLQRAAGEFGGRTPVPAFLSGEHAPACFFCEQAPACFAYFCGEQALARFAGAHWTSRKLR
jgi:hypothetical protein